MTKWIQLLTLAGALATMAGETTPEGSETSATTEALPSQVPEERVLASREAFAVELKDNDLTPEQRAIRIEQWQKQQHALEKQLQAARAALAKSYSPDSDAIAPADNSNSEPPPSDPLLADIHEIESGVDAFRKSLASPEITPEQRAIQIERFQQLNREVLAELKVLKRQAAGRNSTEAAGQVVPDTLPDPQLPQQSAYLKGEIDRVLRDLSEVEPEYRSTYLEVHLPTLSRMMDDLSEASPNYSGENVTRPEPDLNQKQSEP